MQKRGNARPLPRHATSKTSPSEQTNALDNNNNKKKKKGKNQPMEVSSKQRPPRFIDLGTIPTKNKRKYRDPRFDSLSGKYNEDLFNKSYAFVDEYKQDELAELNKNLAREKDPEERERITLSIRRLQSQVSASKRKQEQVEKERERRHMERELVLQGKKPFYTKKGEAKEMDLLQKFTELKKKGNLEKYLERKKRRNATKEHKRIPWRRRTADQQG